MVSPLAPSSGRGNFICHLLRSNAAIGTHVQVYFSSLLIAALSLHFRSPLKQHRRYFLPFQLISLIVICYSRAGTKSLPPPLLFSLCDALVFNPTSAVHSRPYARPSERSAHFLPQRYDLPFPRGGTAARAAPPGSPLLFLRSNLRDTGRILF